jgi:RHS repeat-associated protein
VRARKPHFHGYEVSSEKYYDPLGREYLATQPHGLSGAPAADQQVCYTRQKFDVLGRVIDTWAPSTAAQCTTGTLPAFDAAFPATGRFGHVQYDEVDSATGLLATTYITNFGDPSARTQQKLHNRMGRLRFVRDVLAGGVVYATEFDYDPAGNTSWVKDTAGNITRMGYDLRGRKTSMQDPDMGTWSYGYDALGQLTSQTDAKGQSTTITYDLLGRLLTRAEAAEGTTSWAYDTGPKAIGKLSSVAGTNGYEQAISYDNYGRPADTRTRAATGEAWDWVSQSYDGLGRPDVTTYPARDGSGSTTAGGTASERFQVRAVYAPSGDLWKLEERLTNGGTGTTYWTATGRSAQGALTDESLGNGLYTHQEVDRATGTLGSITTGTTLGGTSVQNLAFTFDAADNLTAREDRVAGLKESFTYDGLQRLSGASRYASLTATTPAETQAYSYDATGNLLGKGSQYTGYSYSAATGCTNAHAQPHAVRQVTAGGSLRSYCYDANGNLTTITGTNAGYTAVSWWASNLARRMSKGSTSAEFWYGPDRARVLQVATRSTESERTVYLGSLYERTVITPNTGSATTRHVHYVRAGDETLAIKTWSKVGTGAYSPQVRYLHRDHLGSVVAITTETGSVESRSSFDAWGKRRDPATWVTPAAGTFTAAPTATDRGYTGHEHVDELGLVHMNGRIYDPEIGKFLSADPTLQFPESTQGYNRYAYAGNNPLSYTDPSGFSFWKKLMSFVGLIINFIPGFQGWSTAFWRGFVTGFLTSGGNLKAALLGGVGGALFGVVGGKTMSFVQRALLHGLIGGSISALGGGKFGSGFLGAFAGGLLSPQIEGLLGAAGTGGTMGTVLRTIASAIVGGISSKLGGGKFLNGAAMAAFARLFNDEGIGHSKRYSVADNVELTPDIEEKVSKIGSAYYESTGSEIVVTSGTRTSLKQANAMYDRIQAGGDFSDYLNQDAAKEVREVYDSGVKAKLSRAEIVASMAGVIKNQVDSGVFISLHLKAGAVDIRSVGMSDKQVISFRKAAEAVTSSVALEQSPPHWHLQF